MHHIIVQQKLARLAIFIYYIPLALVWAVKVSYYQISALLAFVGFQPYCLILRMALLVCHPHVTLIPYALVSHCDSTFYALE